MEPANSNKMILKSARITNFGCFRDSGSVPIDTITALIAVNENGKTTFLRALEWWGQPNVPFDKEDLWEGESSGATVDIVQLEFALPNSAIEALSAAGLDYATPRIRITRRSDGNYVSTDPKTGAPIPFPLPGPPRTEAYISARNRLLDTLREFGPRSEGWHHFDLIAEASPDDSNTLIRLREASEQLLPQYSAEDRRQTLRERFAEAEDAFQRQTFLSVLSPYIPKIIYFDDNIDVLADNVQYANAAADPIANRTMINLAKLAGVDLATVGSLSGYQRQRLGRHAEATLSQAVSRYWKNTSVTVGLQFNETELTVTIQHRGRSQRPSRRSSGLRWHLGFFVNFTAAVLDDLSGAIVLLDEPGLRLHINQQPKLLDLFIDLARQGLTIIYSTHLSYMLLANRPYSWRVIDADPQDVRATRVLRDISMLSSKADVMMPVRQLLGMAIANPLGLGSVNVIAEGMSERYVLLVMSAFCRDAKLPHLPPEVTVLPAGGSGKKMLPLASLVAAEETAKQVILVDDDAAGRETMEVIKRADLGVVQVVRTHEEAEPTERELEDVFDPDFYLDLVNGAHADVEGFVPINLNVIDRQVPICDAIQKRFTEIGLGSFQKLKVAIELERRRDAMPPPDKHQLATFGRLFERLCEALHVAPGV